MEIEEKKSEERNIQWDYGEVIQINQADVMLQQTVSN